MQVVHLYQELRRMMGDEFMVKELNSQNPKECILQGMQPYQALSPAEGQARQRALSEQPSALRVRHRRYSASLMQSHLFDSSGSTSAIA